MTGPIDMPKFTAMRLRASARGWSAGWHNSVVAAAPAGRIASATTLRYNKAAAIELKEVAAGIIKKPGTVNNKLISCTRIEPIALDRRPPINVPNMEPTP